MAGFRPSILVLILADLAYPLGFLLVVSPSVSLATSTQLALWRVPDSVQPIG